MQVLIGKLLFKPGADRGHFGLCLFPGYARLETSDHIHIVRATLLRNRFPAFAVHSHSCPQLDRIVLHRKLKSSRHDADDGVRFPIKHHRLVHYIWIRIKPLLKELLA